MRTIAAATVLVIAACTGAPTVGAPAPAASPAAAPVTSPTPSPTPSAACARSCYGEPRLAGRYDTALVPEASGLAASRRNAGLLYLLDDGPGATGVVAVDRRGRTVAQLTIIGLESTDSEALAVAPCGSDGGGSCLYVGDIGDNIGGRGSIEVWRTPEPRLDGGRRHRSLPAERLVLRYPAGPVDAEAMMVTQTGAVFLISKAAADDGSGRARLYRAGPNDDALTDLGRLPVPEPRSPFAAAVLGNLVSGADHRPGRVLVRTYDAVFEYLPPSGGAALRNLAHWEATEVADGGTGQLEAVAYAADGCGFYTVAEGDPSLWFTPCR